MNKHQKLANCLAALPEGVVIDRSEGSLTFSGNDLKILVIHQYFSLLCKISWEALKAPLFSGISCTVIITL